MPHQGQRVESGITVSIGIEGEGFFIVKQDTSSTEHYTRDGTFYVDDSYDIVNSGGAKLMGWSLETGNVDERPQLSSFGSHQSGWDRDHSRSYKPH